jgi:osmotically-inducible protein OsmY
MNVKTMVAAAGLGLMLAGGAAFASDEPVQDSWITTKVKSELTVDAQTKAYKIHVNTASGVVSLTGDVNTSAEKAQAEKDARGVKGVVDVQNLLKVKSES